jgi:predicted alpha/beta hydrolase family esterase
MRFIIICGIEYIKGSLNFWEKDLKKKFPKSEIILIKKFYYHFQHKKIEKITKKLISTINDSKPTIIIGHSYGGILALAAINRAKKSNIKLLVTLGTPHTMKGFGLISSKKYIKTPEHINNKTLTYGGYLDYIVPFIFTKTSNNIHKNLISEHLGFVYSKKIRTKIIKDIKENL